MWSDSTGLAAKATIINLEAMISKLSAALDKIESGGNEKGLLAALEKQLAQSQARNQEMERRFMEGLERQGSKP